MEHAMRGHLRNSASSAHRWTVCEGCLNFCADLPEPPPSPWAIEGSRKHEELEFSLDIPGLRRPDEPEVDICLEYIYSKKPLGLESERQVFTRGAWGETGGTLDCSFTTADDLHWIFDAKFGYDPINVVNNVQLQIYALCRFTFVGGDIVLVIGQPSAFHPDGPFREWRITSSEMLRFGEWIDERVAATHRPDAPLVPGKHCKYCPGEFVCPAREAQALAVAHESFASVKDINPAVLPLPKDLSVERIARVLDSKDALLQWLSAIEDQAIFLARQGFKVPGRKLVPTQSRRKWKGEPLTIAKELSKLSGRPQAEFLDVVSITEAEKKIGKENREAFAFLTDKQPSGNMALVADSDRRDAVSPTQNAFDGVIIEPVEHQNENMPAPLWPGMTYAEPNMNIEK